MSGDSSQMIAEIQAAIKTGMLTHSEIERRLEAAINAEIDKDDSPADIELIRACQSLLWELDTQGSKAFVDDTEESFAAFQARTNVAEPRGQKPRFVFRAVVTAAAILLIVFGIDTLTYHEGLYGDSTEDQQQYVISGQKTDLGIVDEGQASEGVTEPQSITTTNLDEAIELLGFTPAMPQWIPDGWELMPYYTSKTATGGQFIASYVNDAYEYNLVYQIMYYRDAERASAAFEQNKTGDKVTLSNGKIVYISKNYDDATCVWYEDLACYSLAGPENTNTIIEIIECIKETP